MSVFKGLFRAGAGRAALTISGTLVPAGATGVQAQLRSSLAGALTFSRVSGAGLSVSPDGAVSVTAGLGGGEVRPLVARVQSDNSEAAERRFDLVGFALPSAPVIVDPGVISGARGHGNIISGTDPVVTGSPTPGISFRWWIYDDDSWLLYEGATEDSFTDTSTTMAFALRREVIASNGDAPVSAFSNTLGGASPGGILSVTISQDGWVAWVRHTLGATPAGSFDNDSRDRPQGRYLAGGVDQYPLDPEGTPKFVIQLHAQGYNRIAGQAVSSSTKQRLIVGTKVKRAPHPNNGQVDEVAHGDGSWSTPIALSERVYQSDVPQAASFLAGWRAGANAQALSPASIANSSLVTAPLVISRWARRPYDLVMGTPEAPAHLIDIDVLVSSHHPAHDGITLHQPCAAMELMATDGTNTKTQWFTAPRHSPLYGDQLHCVGGALDLSGLNPGLITIHRRIYPWIGAARATGTMSAAGHSTSITGSNGAAHDLPLQIFYDPTGSRYSSRIRRVFIDTGGTTVTGDVVFHSTVDAARAAASSSKPATLSAALQAARTFLDANPALDLPAANGVSQAGTRAIDFWEFILTDNQVHSIGSGVTGTGSTINGREGLAILMADPASATARTTTILRSGSASVSVQCSRWLWRGFRLELGQATLFGGAGQVIALDEMTVTGKAGYESGSNGFWASAGNVAFVTNCNMFGYRGQPGGQLVRNVTRTASVGGSCIVNVTINTEAGSVRTNQAFSLANDTPDQMIWNARVYGWEGNFFSATAVTGVFGAPVTTLRLAFVNVLIEGVAGNALHQIGEYTYTQMQECIWEGCSLLGGRLNWHVETPMPFEASGTTVTAGVMAHGLLVGDSVTVAGLTPAAYNGTFTVTSVLDANRFRYTAASAPGTLATYQGGTVTKSGGMAMPVVRISLQHTGNCVRNTLFDRNATKQDPWISDGTQTGGHQHLYAVGQSCNFRANRGVGSPWDWQQAFDGLGSETDQIYGYVSSTTPGYVNWFGFANEATNLGTGLFNGDYRPVDGSRLIGKANIACTARDVLNEVRGASFEPGAFSKEGGSSSMALLGPGEDWSGVPGSGFSGSPPASPARIIAQPTLRLLTAPYQAFDSDFDLPFFADCVGGIESVTIWVEGSSSVQILPRFVPYVRPDGRDGGWIAYAVRLDHSAMLAVAIDGGIDVYATAVPANPAFQARTIGPFRFYPRVPGTGAGQRWAADYTVGAGGSHATIAAALTAVRALPDTEAARITLLDDGDYPLGSAGASSKPRRAWTRIQMAPGKTGRLVRATPGGFYGSRPYVDGLEFYGPGLVYDTRELLMEVESNWIAGVRHNGDLVTLEGGTWNRGNQRRATGLGSGGKPLYLENGRVDGIQGPIASATLASNAEFNGFSADAFQNLRTAHAITISGLDYGTLRQPQNQPAMTLAYSGAGIGSIALNGATNTNSRTARLYVDGVEVGNLPLLRGTGETNHTSMGQLVDWINGFAGFTAILLDPSARAAELCTPTMTSPTATWSSPVILSAAPLTFGWSVDAHVDGLQSYEDYHDGQFQYAFITFKNCLAGQLYFVGGQCPDITAGWIETESNSPQPCQISHNSLNPTSHHFIHHSSFAGSTFAIRTDINPYPDTVNCEFSDNVVRKFDWVGSATPNFKVKRIHAFDTASDSGLLVDSSEGGVREEQIPGYAEADFTPLAGGLLMNADGSYRGSRLPSGAWNIALAA